MQKVFINKLKDFVGQEVTLQGWLFNKRSSGKIRFVILRDGTGYVQCVYFKGNVSEEIFDLADKIGRSDYKRKPRGGPTSDDPPPDVYRDSFCCDKEGCRKRHTPPSIRFVGRKVYWSVVVILTSALRHGINDHRLQILRGHLEIDRRTLERWRQWWLGTFVKSEFWKSARARFTPPLCEATLPLSLCEAFGIEPEDHLLKLLQFLGPMTTPSLPWRRMF